MIDARLAAIEQILERNTQSLEEHVRRTNLLEARLIATEDQVAKALQPLKAIRWLVAVSVALGGVRELVTLLQSLGV